jgi:hypothetical protein
MDDEIQKELDNMLKELKEKLFSNIKTHEDWMQIDMSLLQEAADIEAKLEALKPAKPVIIIPIKN